MKICIIGAGAIRGLLAARLAKNNGGVKILARGPQLAAIRDKGLRLIEESGEAFAVAPRAVERLSDVEGQDLLIRGMKAHQVSAVGFAVPGMPAPQ